MHARKISRYLAIFGALSMFVSALPVYAQYGYGYGYGNRNRIPRHLRSQYRASRYIVPGDTLGRVNDAYARGLITPTELQGFTAQYHSAVLNDQRFGGNLHMSALEQNLSDAIYRNRGFRF